MEHLLQKIETSCCKLEMYLLLLLLVPQHLLSASFPVKTSWPDIPRPWTKLLILISSYSIFDLLKTKSRGDMMVKDLLNIIRKRSECWPTSSLVYIGLLG